MKNLLINPLFWLALGMTNIIVLFVIGAGDSIYVRISSGFFLVITILTGIGAAGSIFKGK